MAHVTVYVPRAACTRAGEATGGLHWGHLRTEPPMEAELPVRCGLYCPPDEDWAIWQYTVDGGYEGTATCTVSDELRMDLQLGSGLAPSPGVGALWPRSGARGFRLVVRLDTLDESSPSLDPFSDDIRLAKEDQCPAGQPTR